MFIDRLRYSSILMMIGALSLAGCAATADGDKVPEQAPVRVEVSLTFASAADAEAAAMSLAGMDDGTMVLATTGEVTFDAMVTEAAEAWLLDNPALVVMDDVVREPLYEKNHPSCSGHCGECNPELLCCCDDWCWFFGDCCWDYESVCS